MLHPLIDPESNKNMIRAYLHADLTTSFAITPTATGDAKLTLTLQKASGGEMQTVLTKTVNITVVAEAASVNVTGLLIGDSRISDGAMLSRLDAGLANLTLLGTRQTGGSTLRHEGRGGWSTDHYLNSASVEVAGTDLQNPFYNSAKSTFDFA